jgi:hypothetical protein
VDISSGFSVAPAGDCPRALLATQVLLQACDLPVHSASRKRSGTPVPRSHAATLRLIEIASEARETADLADLFPP